MTRLLAALLIVFALLVPNAALAKGSGVNSLRVDQSGLHYGDTATFTGTVSTAVKYEFVQVFCYQSGVLVWYAGSDDILLLQTGHYVNLKNHIGLTTAHDPGFVLGGVYKPGVDEANRWFGGAASCSADIYSYPYGGVVISITFEVAA